MRAVVFEQTGNPEDVLTVQDRPTPAPARGEVLVRMIASPINPSDLMYIQGAYGIKPSLPATPGFEGVGVVEANGGGLLGRFRRGKRVAVLNDRSGNWCQHTVTTARQVIPVPDEMPDDQAASFFVNPVTAVAMTQKVLKIASGEFLLQTAAGSALGKMIIRLGQVHGFRTINVVRRREQVAELKALGADHVLVESDGPLRDQVLAITSDGVKHAIDPVGGEAGSQAATCLAKRGRMLVYGALSGEPARVDPRFLITASASIEGFWLSNWVKWQSIPTMLGLFRTVKKLVRDGVIKTEIAKEYPLEQVREAVSHAAAAGKGGKILLRMTA